MHTLHSLFLVCIEYPVCSEYPRLGVQVETWSSKEYPKKAKKSARDPNAPRLPYCKKTTGPGHQDFPAKMLQEKRLLSCGDRIVLLQKVMVQAKVKADGKQKQSVSKQRSKRWQANK